MSYRSPKKVADFIGVDLIKIDEMTIFHSIAISEEVELGVIPLKTPAAIERIKEYGGVIPKLTEEILCESICNKYQALALNSDVLGIIFNEQLNANVKVLSSRLDIRGMDSVIIYSFKVRKDGIMYVDDVEVK